MFCVNELNRICMNVQLFSAAGRNVKVTWQTVLYYNANPLNLYSACRPIARFFLPAGQSKKLCGSNALDSRTRQRHSRFLAHTN